MKLYRIIKSPAGKIKRRHEENKNVFSKGNFHQI